MENFRRINENIKNGFVLLAINQKTTQVWLEMLTVQIFFECTTTNFLKNFL